MRILSCSLLVLSIAAPSGCDSNTPKKDPQADQKAAKEADEAKRLEARRKEREAKAAAAKQAEEDKKKQIDALCTVPEGVKAPKKLGDACAQVVQAQASYIERAYAEEPQKLAKLKESAQMQSQMTTQMCMGAASMDVAMCQKNALDNAPVELKKDLNEFMRICIEKYGAKPKGAGAVPAKPQ